MARLGQFGERHRPTGLPDVRRTVPAQGVVPGLPSDPKPGTDPDRARGLYRGWWVAAGGFIMAFYAWGVGFYGHGFYMVVLGRSTGWSVAMLSNVVSVFWLANVAASLLLGRVIDRFGARPVVVYGALAMAAGCLALAAFEAGHLEARWQLFAIFALMGSAYPGLAAMAVSAALVPWFRRRSASPLA